MHEYYEQYQVDWDASKIHDQIMVLENWDIYSDGRYAGALRLEFNADSCYVRDLQVAPEFQNQGIGCLALEKCRDMALEFGAVYLKLKVFQMSPAHQLYKRVGFQIVKEDDRFFYMVKCITK